MADTTALKNRIRAAIKDNNNQEITGPVLQQALLDVVDELNGATETEADARQSGDSTLQQGITAEKNRAEGAESTLEGAINQEGVLRSNADATLQAAINLINSYIPSQASSSNKLADKAFVNSSIATATATFRGTYNVVSDLSLSYNATHAQIQTALATKMSALSITPDNNDYAFVQIPTADATPTQIAKVEKYKYNGTAWAFEYELNNSGFTSAQWAAINSGATLELIGKLSALPTNAELTILLNGKEAVANKVTTITSNSTDTQYASAKAIWTAITAWLSGAMSWTAAQMKQARANLGLGNGDIDNEPTPGSNNLVKSGGITSMYGSYNKFPYFYLITDNEDKIVFAIKKDGSIEWGAGVPTPVKEYITTIADSIISEIKTGSDTTALDGINKIKAFLDGYFVGDTLKDVYGEYTNMPFVEVKADSEGKIVSYRKKDGTLVENVGVETPAIKTESINGVPWDVISNNETPSKSTPRCYNLPKYGYVTMEKELTYTDGTHNYSPSKVSKVGDNYYLTSTLVDGQVTEDSVEITIVENDIDLSQWPVDKTTKHYLKTSIDFGTYLSGTFYIETKYQGNSTLLYAKKNFRFGFYKDILFTSKKSIKIGELISAKKFNLKAYWRDMTLLKEHTCYRMVQAIRETRKYVKQYPWNGDYFVTTEATGITNGFPVRVDVGNSFQGVYWFGLAKDKNNFMLNDDPMTGVLVQGDISSATFWQTLDATQWDDILADIDNGISEDSLPHVQGFYDYINGNTLSKETASEHLNIDNWVDCIIIYQTFATSDMLTNNAMLYAGADKTIFSPMYYDMDYTFGAHGAATRFVSPTTDIFTSEFSLDISLWLKIKTLFWSEICERYKELRGTVLNMEYITSMMENMARQIPFADYEKDLEKYPDVAFSAGDILKRGRTLSTNLEWMESRLTWMDTYFVEN